MENLEYFKQMQPVKQPVPVKDNEVISFDDKERVAKQLASFSGLPEVTGNTSNLIYFAHRYEQEGQNLYKLYEQAETRTGITVRKKAEQMHNNFVNNKEHGEFTQFVELLPLLANKDGRLGPFVTARVTKTAKPDDAGGSFVDLVFEIKNEYLKTEEAQADRFLRNVRPSISFAVDVTSNPDTFEIKVNDFQRYELKTKGDKAHVFAYEQKFPGGITRLGIDTLKCVVLRDERYLADTAKRFRPALTASSQGGFVIADEKYFNKVYQEFFWDFLKATKRSTLRTLVFLDSLSTITPKQKDLKIAYQSLVNFLEAYEKTPSN